MLLSLCWNRAREKDKERKRTIESLWKSQETRKLRWCPTFRASVRSKSFQEWMGDRDRNFDVLCDVSESAMSQSVLCISLPSHGSLSEFPHNQPISFKIRLPFPLQLDVMWEVGLNSVTLFK